VIGTPLYLAPEAFAGGWAVDARCDLYALGAVGYYLVTGQPVFTGRTTVEVLAHHLNSAPPPPSTRSANPVPPALERLLLQCLAKIAVGSAGRCRDGSAGAGGDCRGVVPCAGSVVVEDVPRRPPERRGAGSRGRPGHRAHRSVRTPLRPRGFTGLAAASPVEKNAK
jgi:serine/threonine protein kinase